MATGIRRQISRHYSRSSSTHSSISQGDDYSFQDELEFLQNVYCEELQLLSERNKSQPCTLSFQLTPSTADDKDKQFVYIEAHVTVNSKYPNSKPTIKIIKSRGLSDTHLNSISVGVAQLAAERLGTPVIYDLIEYIRDCLTNNNRPYGRCVLCQFEFQDDDQFVRTECYHYFHPECLVNYIHYCDTTMEEQFDQITMKNILVNKELECPVCRVVLDRRALNIPDGLRESIESEELLPVDGFCEVSDSVLVWQKEMAVLYQKQLAKGGIIIDTSDDVIDETWVSSRGQQLGDQEVKTGLKEEECGEQDAEVQQTTGQEWEATGQLSEGQQTGGQESIKQESREHEEGIQQTDDQQLDQCISDNDGNHSNKDNIEVTKGKTDSTDEVVNHKQEGTRDTKVKHSGQQRKYYGNRYHGSHYHGNHYRGNHYHGNHHHRNHHRSDDVQNPRSNDQRYFDNKGRNDRQWKNEDSSGRHPQANHRGHNETRSNRRHSREEWYRHKEQAPRPSSGRPRIKPSNNRTHDGSDTTKVIVIGNEATVTGSEATVTGKDSTVTGNGASVTGNGATVTRNETTVAGNKATMTGNGTTVTGNEATVSTSTMTQSTCTSSSGNQYKSKENDSKLTRNKSSSSTGNKSRSTENQSRTTGNHSPLLTENQLRSSQNQSSSATGRSTGNQSPSLSENRPRSSQNQSSSETGRSTGNQSRSTGNQFRSTGNPSRTGNRPRSSGNHSLSSTGRSTRNQSRATGNQSRTNGNQSRTTENQSPSLIGNQPRSSGNQSSSSTGNESRTTTGNQSKLTTE